MHNPWLDIPLADYEAHMALPQVGQAQLLAGLLGAAVERYAPESVAVLGCAGGNGFERVPPDTRLVGIDVNPAYLEAARARFGHRPGLELYCADVTTEVPVAAAVDLVFAALVFEYAEARQLLAAVATKQRPGAKLVAVLQLPADVAEVTPSPYVSLTRLAPVMRLVPPEELVRAAAACGYSLVGTETVAAGGGKQFAVQTFRRDGKEL